MEYIATKPFSLRSSKVHDEKWLQELLAGNESILGLGNIEHVATERTQNNGGRLDLMFQSESGSLRYCVELQLGATDANHIMRTIEYWDNERSRNPHIEHVAVIVAEDITTRFLNVISLFNKSIPLIAVQLNAFEVNGQIGINCVKVLDIAQNIGWEDDNTSSKSVTDRTFWEKKATPNSVKFADKFLEIIKETTGDDDLVLKYNKHYIGLAHHGVADNFMSFKPRKNNMILQFRIPFSEDLQTRLEETFDVLNYRDNWGLWQIRITEKDFKENVDFLKELIRTARRMPTNDAEDD
jgi:predicted transport protein